MQTPEMEPPVWLSTFCFKVLILLFYVNYANVYVSLCGHMHRYLQRPEMLAGPLRAGMYGRLFAT